MAFAGAAASAKTDNHPAAFKAKVAIRRNVLAAIAPANVFDAYAGAGQMHAAVWSKAQRYVGCDLKYLADARTMFVGDNRRVLRAIDLAPFNVFDLDAYGSPWEAALIIADRRKVKPAELLGVIITEGAGLSYKANVMPLAVTALTGLRQGIVGLSRKHDDVINLAIAGLARRMGCSIEKRWQAERNNTGPAPRYVGLVLKGIAQ
jgi:hypothetical protein